MSADLVAAAIQNIVAHWENRKIGLPSDDSRIAKFTELLKVSAASALLGEPNERPEEFND